MIEDLIADKNTPLAHLREVANDPRHSLNYVRSKLEQACYIIELLLKEKERSAQEIERLQSLAIKAGDDGLEATINAANDAHAQRARAEAAEARVRELEPSTVSSSGVGTMTYVEDALTYVKDLTSRLDLAKAGQNYAMSALLNEAKAALAAQALAIEKIKAANEAAEARVRELEIENDDLNPMAAAIRARISPEQ